MRYCIAARVSPKGSGWDREETSISAQVEIMQRWIRERDPDGTIDKILIEEFVSGGDLAKRPKMLAELEACDAGRVQWDAMLVYDQTRQSRSLLDTLVMQKRLEAAGKVYIAVSDGIDTRDAGAMENIQVRALFAEWMRKRIAKDTKRNMVQIAAAGGWPSGNTPYGYRRSGKRHDNVLQVDEREAAIVREIFKRYAGGESVDSIWAAFRPTPRLSKNSMLNMLRNRIYLGELPYDGQFYPGRHAAIIDAAVYQSVQDRLPNGRKSPRPSAQQYPYLLTGILHCQCGRRLTAATHWGRSRQYHYYQCTDKTCRHAFSAEPLERFVADLIRKAPLSPAVLTKTLREIRRLKDDRRRDHGPELEKVREARKDVNLAIGRVEQAFLSGIVTKANSEHWNEKLTGLVKEGKRLEAREEELRGLVGEDMGVYEDADQLARDLATYADALDKCGDSPSAKRNAILALVETIEIQPDGKTVRVTLRGVNSVQDGCPAWI